jgi:hypothetical protein
MVDSQIAGSNSWSAPAARLSVTQLLLHALNKVEATVHSYLPHAHSTKDRITHHHRSEKLMQKP